MNPARRATAVKTPPQRVRIVGGRWKRRLLPVLNEVGLRPTADRVRETLFNWLGQSLDGTVCIDLFAGTGALGFEAASRGADTVHLCDANPRVIAQLQANAKLLEAGNVVIHRGDALAFAATLPAGCADVVFVDPPFAADLLVSALRAAARLVRDGGAVYVETGAPFELDTLAAQCPDAGELTRLEPFRDGRAGLAHFQLLRAKNS